MESKIKQKTYTFFSTYRKQTFQKGQILIQAGNNPSGVFYLQKGIVRQYYLSLNGEEITLNMFKDSAFFPMSWAISDISNHYYYEAMTDCEIFKAPRENVLAFIQHEPDIVLDLLRRVYIGIEGLWLHMVNLASGNSYTKLISTLVILGKRFGEKKNEDSLVIAFKMTEKDLGEYAGMYRETVSRELQVLKKRGLVTFEKGSLTILNIEQLESELTL